MIKFTAALLIYVSSFAAPAIAQDSVFIYNYREFRSLVDSFKTFSLYIVPYQSSKLYPIYSVATIDYLKNAYHFLRDKKAVRKNPDFVIAVVIDSLQLEYFTEERTRTSNMKDFYVQRARDSSRTGRNNSDITQDQYVRKYVYQLTYKIVVETNQQITFSFPLAVNEKITSTASYSKSNDLWGLVLNQLENVLISYKNYYIDRVDW